MTLELTMDQVKLVFIGLNNTTDDVFDRPEMYGLGKGADEATIVAFIHEHIEPLQEQLKEELKDVFDDWIAERVNSLGGLE